MRKAKTGLIAGVILGAALASGVASAAPIEIPLPGLLGLYSSGGVGTRSTTFVLPSQHPVINSIALRIHGTTEVGSKDCGQFGGVGPWQTDVYAYMFANPGQWSVEQFSGVVAGSFGWTQTFFTSSGATWAFLDPGVGTIFLSGFPAVALPECVALTPPPSVTIDEATLLVDAEFPTPAHPWSWGRVKVAYR